MKTLKSKQNIIVLILTSVICLVIIGYALINVYNTKLARSSSTSNTDTTSISKLSPSTSIDVDNSNFYKTLTLASSKNTEYVYNSINFDNPFNVAKVGEYTIVATGENSGSNNEQYLVNSECYIYSKLKINNFIPVSLTDDASLNGILDDFQVDFYIDGHKLTASDITGVGQSCWNNFCIWNNNITEHTAKCTLNDDGTFYVAVRTILNYNLGSHLIEIKYNDVTLDSFNIIVRDYTQLMLDVDNYKLDLRSSAYASKIWGYTNGFSFAMNNYHNNQSSSAVMNYDNNVSPGTTISPNLSQVHDYYADNNLCNYSALNTACDFKVLLLYPEFNYEISQGDLVSLEGAYPCSEGHMQLNGIYYPQYYKFQEATHQIPENWNNETYTVKEVFFNEWCPNGQAYWTIYHTYKVDLISINLGETLKQETNYPSYIENSEIYTYVAMDFKGNIDNIKDISAKFTISDDGEYNNYVYYDDSQGNHLGEGINRRSKHGQNSKDYTKGNELSGTIQEEDGSISQIVYLSIRWRTPNVENSSINLPIKIDVYNKDTQIDHIEFNIQVYDIDYINEYANIKNHFGNNLLDLSLSSNKNYVLEFENATKKYYEDKVNGIDMKNLLSKNLDDFFNACLKDVGDTYEYKNMENRANINVEFSDGKQFNFGLFLTENPDALKSINGSNQLLNYNEIYNVNYSSKSGDNITIPVHDVNDENTKFDSINWCFDQKVILLYPEYGYNTNFGDMLIVEDYNTKTDYNFKSTIKNKNVTIEDINKQHSIPLWWNEDEYTVVAIYFGNFCPLGQLYYAEQITYNIEGSVYGDWYITRNVD